jgi:hypothetical protein
MDQKAGSEHLRAAVRARLELGEEYEQALVESFVEQIDDEIEALVDARVAEYARNGALARRPGWAGGVFLVSSLIFAIPLSAVAGAFGHLSGLAVAWGGIVVVNLANAWRSSGMRRQR